MHFQNLNQSTLLAPHERTEQPMLEATLPIELCELVIDFVDDEATLQSTSLVCKAWITRSQYNLFRAIELNWTSHADRFLELLLAAPHLA